MTTTSTASTQYWFAVTCQRCRTGWYLEQEEVQGNSRLRMGAGWFCMACLTEPGDETC